MNRRDFLRRLTVGGVAAATAVQEWPFRVFSFPQEIKIATSPIPIPIPIRVPPEIRVRFIRAFDPLQAKMANRWHVLYGFMKLDERPPDFMLSNVTSDFKVATPEEAKRLGFITPRDIDLIEGVSRGMGEGAEDFEATAIAPVQRFRECYELTEPIKEAWED